jgi:peptidyl-prolyl cis-trans isomerase B (cyclophilin B)
VRVVLSLLAVLALAGCGGGGNDGNTTTSSGCTKVDAPKPKPNGGAKKPSTGLDPEKTYVLAVETSCGDFEITLNQDQSPHATASLVALARSGFFDDTTFHRVVPGFVIQGGDPTGTGAGGPGYTTVDTPSRTTSYTRGIVAMAKTQAQPPGTAGSQFFVVTAKNAQLPPDYAVVGIVSRGYDVVQRIEALGDVSTEQPSQTVLVERVSVRER